jgi:hypothetical protein
MRPKTEVYGRQEVVPGLFEEDVTRSLEQSIVDQVVFPTLARSRHLLRLVGRSVRRARGGVILKSTTNSGGLL